MKKVLGIIIGLVVILGLSYAAYQHFSKPSANKILVVMSGVDFITLEDGKTHPTGFFLPELTTPLQGLLDAGYEVVFANPTGKEPAMDATSDSAKWFDSEKEYKKAKELLASLPGFKNPVKLSSLSDGDLKEYQGIFLPGGHAPMEDLYRDKDLGRILRYFHNAQKPTALICHAPIALLSAREGGDWPYKGYRMTVFSDVEEKIGEDAGAFGGKLKFYPENALAGAGAIIQNSAEPWQPNAVGDRELITGQNPMSHHVFTERFLESLSKK